MAVELSQAFPGAEVTLVESKGGAFEVSVDGRRVFSKLAEGRFPSYREVPGLLT
ncbi:MAG: SelT/SelW/SelH family protein [Planctomycetes bacterium]|nr:SelT/SelW/SelH family protein [Planctomycetota bacterium]